MKKLLFLLLLIPMLARAQFPQPTGLNPFGSALFLYKIVGSDTLVYAKSSNGLWFPMGRASDIVFSTNFQGLGILASPLDLANSIHVRDTGYFGNNVFISDTTNTANNLLKVFRRVGGKGITGRFGVSIHGGASMATISQSDTVNTHSLYVLPWLSQPVFSIDNSITLHRIPVIDHYVGLTYDTTTYTLTATGGGSGTSTPTANTISKWDGNVNLSANSFISGYQTIATAAGTTTLTVTSPYQTFFTGTTTQTVVLPVTSTLVLGEQFTIVNNSTGIVTVNSSGANLVQAINPTSTAVFTCVLTSGTAAASWSVYYYPTVYFASGTFSGAGTLASPYTITGALTSLNGLTGTTQTFNTGTSGSSFNISSTGTTHTFNIPNASASNVGTVNTGSQTFAGAKTFTSDLSVNGMVVGAGNTLLNTVLGYQALINNTSGFGNDVAIGYQALTANTTGNSNTAVGYLALSTSTTASANTAVGSSSLSVATGGGNTGVGASTLLHLTSGTNNTAVGVSALANVTTALDNVAIGSQALTGAGTSSAIYNTAIGYSPMPVFTSGYGNIAIGGSQPLAVFTSGNQNIAIGNSAASNLTGASNNTFVGANAGNGITTGGSNTIIGSNIGSLSTTLASNVLIADGGGHIQFLSDGSGHIILGTNGTTYPTINGFGVELTGTARIDGSLTLKPSLSAINATAAATAAQIAVGAITSTSAAATSITLPTATLMATGIGAAQGTIFSFTVDNTAGANTVTIILGSGMTGLNSPTLTIGTGASGVAKFELYFSSTTACTVARIY